MNAILRIPDSAGFAFPRSIAIYATAIVSSIGVGLLFGSGRAAEAVALALFALGLIAWIGFKPRPGALLVFWFATAPMGAYLLRLPFEKSLLTFDRAVFALVALAMAAQAWRSSPGRGSGVEAATDGDGIRLTRFEVLWLALSVLAVTSSVLAANELGYSLKIAFDAFALPLIAFHAARRFITPGDNARLVTAAMAVALLLFIIGASEVFFQRNLFPFPGSELYREGELRVNGPFNSDSSFAIICLLLLLFLKAAPDALGVRLSRSALILYIISIGAAALGAMLPVFRVVAAALVVCFVGLVVAGGRSESRRPRLPALSRLALIGVVLVALILPLAMALPGAGSVIERIASARNVYGRLASWQAAVTIVSENPAFGVGLANYLDHFNERYSEEERPGDPSTDIWAPNTPHSNPLWIAAELGSAGIILYLFANLFLFLPGYRAFRKSTGRARTASACYLALFAAYWIPGLTLSSGMYSDLNLYFFFLMGLLYSRLSNA